MSSFAPSPIRISMDQDAYLQARNAGALEVHSFAHTCPACGEPWTAEYPGTADQFQSKPDPVRLGMALLCGTCEAKRRLLVNGERGGTAYFGESDLARAWGRIRNQARAWVVGRNLGNWDGSALRDDKDSLMRMFLRAVQARGGVVVPEDLREKWGWEAPSAYVPRQPSGRMGYAS